MGKSVGIVDAQPTAVTPASMITQALTNGAGVEVMAQLLSMQKEYDAMQARKAFDNAMAELRQNMPEVIKTQTVDFTTSKGRTNYKYEDLSAVAEALSPVMAGLGLSFRWRTDNVQNGVSVTCIISHREGHSEETTLSAGFDNSGNKNALQALGSAVTYLQRYTLKAAVGIAAARDDDGQGAGAPKPPVSQPKAKSRDAFEDAIKATRAAISVEELKEIWNSPDVQTMPEDWKQDVSDEITARINEINAASKPVDPKSSLDEQFPGDMETA